MTVQEIVTRVRSAIDELMENDSDFIRQSGDEANLTRVIVDKIGYALQEVVEKAPLSKLDSSTFATLTAGELASSFTITQDLVGHLILPSDLLRIIDARLSSWSQYPLPEPDTSDVAMMQQDSYARGSYDRPVNIITFEASNRVLLMYSARTSGDTLKFVFVRKPNVSGISASNMSQNVSVPSQLEAALVYQVAALAMVAFREDVAASLFAIAQRYLNLNQEGPNTAEA